MLASVIAALTDKRRTHVPYRDSKLTHLLQVGPDKIFLWHFLEL
jgi:hypothetical protein